MRTRPALRESEIEATKLGLEAITVTPCCVQRTNYCCGR